MNFGQAIEALKAGSKVSRSGWNGKRMWLVLVPHIDMWTINAEGRRAMLPDWVASQTDMLADDWSIVP